MRTFMMLAALAAGGSLSFIHAAPATAPGPFAAQSLWVEAPSLAPSPNPQAPLGALISAETSRRSVLSLAIDDGEKAWSATPVREFLYEHEVPVLGLRPDRLHTITVTATSITGMVTTYGPLTFLTPPLPPLFPTIETTVSNPASMEPGVTLLNALVTHPNIPGSEWGLMLALDAAGDVVWFYNPRHQITDVRRLSNGNLLYISNRIMLVEVDMFGVVVDLWWASGVTTDGAPPGATMVATDSFHHEAIELPASFEGDFAVLSTEVRAYPNYPANENDLSELSPSTNVVGDVIVEFRRDGSIVKEWRMLDYFDPYRISYDSLGPFWNNFYGMQTADWSHGNAVVLDAEDDAWIVSLRSQEAVVKLRRNALRADWILGPHEGWKFPWSALLLNPVDDPALLAQGYAPFEWQYHQHSPQVLPDGSMMIFDNGNGRAVAPDPQLPPMQRYSRAVQYDVDDDLREVRQLWSYGSPDDLWYSSFVGDADVLPMTQNVLVTDGGKATNQLWARIVEVTKEVDPQIVFEVELRHPDPSAGIGWTVYRAERLPSVLP